MLFYARINKDKGENIGIKRKLLAQQNSVQAFGIKADLVWYGHEGIYLNHQLIHRRSFGNGLNDYLYFLWNWDSLILRMLDISSYDLVYIRYALSHPGFFNFLAKTKAYLKLKSIILEFPTFPYDKELSSGSALRRIAGVMDRIMRKSLIKYIDLAVHYGQGQIFDLPTVNLTNGIELEGTSICARNQNKNRLNIACVGSWNFWHGLDRLLDGVAIYRSEVADLTLTIKIIGKGRALENLRQLTQELSLEDIVEFYPETIKGDLVDLLAETDFAVGALAMFRKDIFIDSSLKHREYCALGLPFILATHDPDFPRELSYVHYVPAENKALDLAKIVDWVRGLHESYPNFQLEMRNYAEEHLSWNTRFKTILDALKD